MKKSNTLAITLTDMTKVALLAALFCVLSPHTIYLPITPIGITLGSLVVYLAGGLLGARLSALSVLLYLLLGFIGLPVFSGYSAGAARLLGSTGGYLLGYLPCAIVIGLFAKQQKNKRKEFLLFLFSSLFGTLLLYLLGTLWFVFVYAEKISFFSAFQKCVVPFIPFDLCKIFAAAVLLLPLRQAFHRD